MKNLFESIRNAFKSSPASRRHSRTNYVRLQVEALEGRLALSPTISIASALSIDEGGFRNITLSRSGDTSRALTINYNLIFTNGTAKYGMDKDYVRTANTSVTFAAGKATATAGTVTTIQDTVDEYNETFYVELRLAAGTPALLGNNKMTATINDNDAPPYVTIQSMGDISENLWGGIEDQDGLLVVKLSQASEKTVEVSYAAVYSTTSVQWGRDWYFTDHRSDSGAMLIFHPGSTLGMIRLKAIDDSIIEADESFQVNVTSATNAGLALFPATVTIVDNDVPVLSIADARPVNEGNGTGAAATAVFNVHLEQETERDVVVKYWTNAGDANSTTDYVGRNSTMTFKPGEHDKPVTVTIKGDTVKESSAENFYANIGQIDTLFKNRLEITRAKAKGTILDDDAQTPPSTPPQPAPPTQWQYRNLAGSWRVLSTGERITVTYETDGFHTCVNALGVRFGIRTAGAAPGSEPSNRVEMASERLVGEVFGNGTHIVWTSLSTGRIVSEWVKG